MIYNLTSLWIVLKLLCKVYTVGAVYFRQVSLDAVISPTIRQAALDREYTSADGPKYQLLRDPLPVAPPTFGRAMRAYKVDQ